MTTETVQGAPAYEEEESFFLPQMCDGRRWERVDCDNIAVYRCRVQCCGGMVWWCEECLFAWIEFSSGPGNTLMGWCMFCDEYVVIRPDWIKVIGRIA